MIRNPAKALLRSKVKQTLKTMLPESRKEQSQIIFNKVSSVELKSLSAITLSPPQILQLSSFATAKRVSIYLSTDTEVNTLPILEELFRRDKQVGVEHKIGFRSSTKVFKFQVFVPTYDNSNMEMVRLHSLVDYESLPVTKWNIKQPVCGERENALEIGNGLYLICLAPQII